MDKELAEMRATWQEARVADPGPRQPTAEILQQAKVRKKESIRFQGGNIAVLSVVFIGISLFFRFVAPMATTLGRIGIGLMLGSLFLRILIECYTWQLGRHLYFHENADAALNMARQYHRLRRIIHGPLTAAVLILYTVGLLFLFPEFSLYLPFNQLTLFLGLYIVAALVLFWRIGREVKKELRQLAQLTALQQELHSGTPDPED